MLELAIIALLFAAPPCPEAPEVCVWVGPYCPACESMKPIITELRAAGWPVYTARVEKYPQRAAEWKIVSWPTLQVLHGGKEILRCTGLASRDYVEVVLRVCGVRQLPVTVTPSPQSPAPSP